MPSYYQVYNSCNKPNCKCKTGKKHGPYWWMSIYTGSAKGKKSYNKIYLGKDLVKGLVKFANKDKAPLVIEEVEKLITFRKERPDLTDEQLADKLTDNFDKKQFLEQFKSKHPDKIVIALQPGYTKGRQ